VEDIPSGAQKWSLLFVGIGVLAIVSAMFQVCVGVLVVWVRGLST
jgi:hypothetical protein